MGEGGVGMAPVAQDEAEKAQSGVWLGWGWAGDEVLEVRARLRVRWAEARIKITRMTLTVKLDRNWSSFQLANSAPPLSVTGSAIAPSARIAWLVDMQCMPMCACS